MEVARQRWRTLQAEARESVGLAAPVFLQDGELVASSDEGSELGVEEVWEEAYGGAEDVAGLFEEDW